jgi:hypothetical protein
VAGAARTGSPREPVTPEDVHRALVASLGQSKLHARVRRRLMVSDVWRLTEVINDFIANPITDAEVEGQPARDVEIRADLDAIARVERMLREGLDRQLALIIRLAPREKDPEGMVYPELEGLAADHQARVERYAPFFAELDRLRQRRGLPLFKERLQGPSRLGRSVMAFYIADMTLRVLNWLADRYGARRQRGYGKKDESPILVFTIAMLKLISPGEDPPSPGVLAEILTSAKAALRGAPE